MTRATHTPGPMTQGASSAGKTCVWLGGATEPPHEMGPDTTWIDCNTEANARRVAACWNACDGFSIEELEGADLFKDSIESGNLINELLAALEKIVEMNVRWALDQYGDAKKAENMDCVRVARAAIAKATAQQ